MDTPRTPRGGGRVPSARPSAARVGGSGRPRLGFGGDGHRGSGLRDGGDPARWTDRRRGLDVLGRSRTARGVEDPSQRHARRRVQRRRPGAGVVQRRCLRPDVAVQSDGKVMWPARSNGSTRSPSAHVSPFLSRQARHGDTMRQGHDFTDGLDRDEPRVASRGTLGYRPERAQLLEMEPERQRILADPRAALELYAAEMPQADRDVLRTHPRIEAMSRTRCEKPWWPSSEGWLDDSVAYAEPWGFDPGSITVPVSIWHGA